MKRYSLFAFLALLLFVVGIRVHAEETKRFIIESDTNPDRSNVIRQDIRLKTQEQSVRTTVKPGVIKDKKKTEQIERLTAELNAVNKKKIAEYQKSLTQIETLLQSVVERIEKKERQGVDVAAARLAVESAKTSIAAARTVIETQAGKTYTVSITSEANAKTALLITRKQMEADLKKVAEAVRFAREGVRKATVALAQKNKQK